MELLNGRLADAGLIEVFIRASIPLVVMGAGLLVVLLLVDRMHGRDT